MHILYLNDNVNVIITVVFKIQWLEKDFLTYISNWKSAIQKTDFEAKEKAKMGLSAETTEGLLITGKKIVYFLKCGSNHV